MTVYAGVTISVTVTGLLVASRTNKPLQYIDNLMKPPSPTPNPWCELSELPTVRLRQ